MSQPLTDPLYLDVTLAAGAGFGENLDPGHNAFVYVISGELQIAGDHDAARRLRRDQLGVLGEGASFAAKAGEQQARFLLVAGKPLNEPVARGGPFVMNTADEVRQAFADYQQGNF